MLRVFKKIQIPSLYGIMESFNRLDVHRNPSGTHNKVRWILSESKWNIVKIKILFTKVNINPGDLTQSQSWLTAFNIACLIASDETNKLQTYVKKYPWVKKYMKK